MTNRKVFVAEVAGDFGRAFEDEAIAAIEAEDGAEARDFLVPAIMAMNERPFETGAERWDETSPIITREATDGERAEWLKRKAALPPNRTSPVVWLVDCEPKR
jgi:hypothetical protein